MTSKTSNSYVIEIFFEGQEHSPEREILTINSNYLLASNNTDEIYISNKMIKVTASRSSKIDYLEAFNRSTSTLNKQLIKAISYRAFFYSSCINSLRFQRSRKVKLDEIKLNSSDIRQILPDITKPVEGIDSQALQVIFAETEKGGALLKAVTKLLMAISEKDISVKFEKHWKALNRIYYLIGGTDQDFDAQIVLRNFILNNPECFQKSIDYCNSLSQDELRTKFRWREMIINNFSNSKHTKNFHDFVLRYSDERIMKLLSETLVYREKFLEAENLLVSVQSHINKHIQSSTKRDAEVLALLAIKYSYFVRNKLVHNERIDVSFSVLPNDEEKEILWLDALLQKTVVELINCESLY